MYFNQRESKLPVAEASLSVQKDLLIRGTQAKIAALISAKKRRNTANQTLRCLIGNA